ncbi:hypothetical protein CC80DRAFT_423781 [Byssothecium circinans]|uniref:Uncharacterized protein n=1 Tax=Byssothecium circinans TaxID=147558 RepID=A0A6A5TIC8_9PLEO|nr:hypothetical protein CC80DRAFT_423781 [Byssothecium circinans]
MDQGAVAALMRTVHLISTNLDATQDSWRDHLQTVRSIICLLDFSDAVQDNALKEWQLPVITVFQRVAYADVDSGGSGVFDIADWCLRQTLTLLQTYPEEADLLARKSFRSVTYMFIDLLLVAGRNWLLRAQRPLARIHETERSSTSSGESQERTLSSGEEQKQDAKAALEAEHRLHTADYVEARGLLLPAVEYMKHAVGAAEAQNSLCGPLLATAAEAYMSLGNVSSARINEPYYHQALSYLRKASEASDYSLPTHLQQYVPC